VSNVGQLERKTQDRVVAMFQRALGYDYLGNLAHRAGNSNIEAAQLRANLLSRGYTADLANKAILVLEKAAAVGDGRHLYEANKDVYELLRYGVKVRPEAGKPKVTIYLIDWEHVGCNHFAVAEEVTVGGTHTKRPDVVLYINGIAVVILELKRSFVSVSEGIRQNLGNQKAEFIQPFFSTVQLVMAGNDVEGLRYGVIGTTEKYWLSWREDSVLDDGPLDVALQQMCSKTRLLEIVHDFVVFDSGVKKACRHNQYFGVHAAQQRIAAREDGIIWHTQGSGKSLTMVWLAQWILENQDNARVLVITDRTELDDQIEGVFQGVHRDIYRTKSGQDLFAALASGEESLICSLVHKFGRGAGDDPGDEYVTGMRASVPSNFAPVGNLFVFVDECHRTQSGKMHAAMRELLPDAMFIGFTGTPLLKSDKSKSIKTFGSYIHTYKYNEAVRDGVVLDLRYEARNVDQEITSPAKVDQWFEAKTRGLADHARAELKKRWGTVQKVLSSKSRAERIASDILMDMETRPRLADKRGNAILVSGSIYQACQFYEMFNRTSLKGKVAIVTSYAPNPSDIANADSGEGQNEALRQYAIYRQMLADHFGDPADTAARKVDAFEEQVKAKFVDYPGQMRLLIVVDMLLTGFDAPSATYLYIDKEMSDHNLFQAICRVNRLDGEDKDYGYIVDYKDLFLSIESAVCDYTTAALDGYDSEDVVGLLENRVEKGRERLDETLENIRALCEPVEPPKGTPQYQHYFCTSRSGDIAELKTNEPRRVALYKAVTALTRAYANIANDMCEAGYSPSQTAVIKEEIQEYERARQEIKLGAGENIDYRAYEADMRYLLDTYIRAGESEVLTTFENQSLIELIAEQGVEAATDQMPAGIKDSREAVAETITNNIRKVITEEKPINPKYYDTMSQLLDTLIEELRTHAIEYRQYLEYLSELAKRVTHPEVSGYPEGVKTGPQRALFDNLGRNAELAIRLDTAIRGTKKDGWRGNRMKEREVQRAIRRAVDGLLPAVDVDFVFDLVKHQDEY